MTTDSRTVLITGCSDGGLGSALAIAFHKAGLHVYATARNPSKLTAVKALGIETLVLDITSESSITECVSRLSKLDILVNNAGGGYSMPVSDISIPEAKKLFDLNVWAHIAIAQAFLPLLLESKGIIVNHTSIASVSAFPFQAAYNASKAAMAIFSDSLRLELSPFGVRVVELKTGAVASNLIKNQNMEGRATLPETSIYLPAREAVEKTMRAAEHDGKGTAPQQWADNVVHDLLKKTPPSVIWRGMGAFFIRLASILPSILFEGTVKRIAGLDVVAKAVGK